MCNKAQLPAPRRQRGAAFITALIMLVLVTILAMSSMTRTTMDERMAANSQQNNQAFQAAETGLSIVWNDSDAFSTLNTAASDGTSSDPYNKTAVQLGGSTGPQTKYNSVYRQETVPPRGSGWDSSMAYYHFDLTATGTTAGGATVVLHEGAYQVGKRQ